MKTAYSTYCSPFWGCFKRAYPRRTETDFVKAIRLLIEQAKINGSYFDADTAYVDNVIEFIWRFRKIKHFFLAPGIADFCIDSVKELTNDYCKRLPECLPVEPLPNFEIMVDGNKEMQGGFAIHFPSKERQRSVLVWPNASIPQADGKHVALYYCAATDGIDTVVIQKDNNFPEGDGTWIAKLVFGLSLYMDAFPDAVVDAGSESVHQINRYTGARHIVNRNEIVDEEHRHGVSPHWRRGHFRLLTAERFVHKQGLTVYVRGAFIKGKAFDVLDDAPLIDGK